MACQLLVACQAQSGGKHPQEAESISYVLWKQKRPDLAIPPQFLVAVHRCAKWREPGTDGMFPT